MDPNALHLLLAGSLIISIAANILLGSRVAHYRALYVKWNDLAADINNKLNMSQHEFVDMRAKRTMMAEAYKHKDRECEVLRAQKSEINAKYIALVKTIKDQETDCPRHPVRVEGCPMCNPSKLYAKDEKIQRADEIGKYVPHQFTAPPPPPEICKCGSGKPYLVSRGGKVLTFCVDCEPF